MRELIVAAHPDDEILGCGGYIAKYHDTHELYVVILTNGAEGRYEKSMVPTLKNQAIKANQIVGTKEVYFENLPNQGMDTIPLTDSIGVIEKYIDMIKPTTLFIHSSKDLNKDHRIVYEAGITAARPYPGQSVERIYTYFTASSTEWNSIGDSFMPNTYVTIKKELEKKIKAMKCYTTECRPYPHPRSAEALTHYASFWGISAGMEYAEPFALVRNVIK
ncbi:MAG: PIG-L deacetylase family protein [bacterium]